MRDRIINDPFKFMQQFTVRLDLTQQQGYISKRLLFIDQAWKTSSQSLPLTPLPVVRGIATGERSNITIIDMKVNSDLYKSLPEELLENTFRVKTPNGGMHLYFKYDSRLNSIYDILSGVSVLNNERFTFAGGSYTVYSEDKPIIAMPATLFDTLNDAQTHPENDLVVKFDEVFSALGDDWFSDRNILRTLVFALRNTKSSKQAIINTISKSIIERNGWYDIYMIEALIEERMTYIDKRYTLTTLKRDAMVRYGDEEFDAKLRHIKLLREEEADKKRYPRLRYVPTALTRLRDIKNVYPTLTARKLLARNELFIATFKHVCRHCSSIHQKDCCDQYDYRQRTTAQYIQNVSIV